MPIAAETLQPGKFDVLATLRRPWPPTPCSAPKGWITRHSNSVKSYRLIIDSLSEALKSNLQPFVNPVYEFTA